jgi:hypothetical protein
VKTIVGTAVLFSGVDVDIIVGIAVLFSGKLHPDNINRVIKNHNCLMLYRIIQDSLWNSNEY